MSTARIGLERAIRQTRTGDVWLFRGRTLADRTIQVTTNSPVNHVGMAVCIEDLPPLMWHAEMGRSLVDVWTGTRQRGAQLHVLRDAVITWVNRYGQRAWFRQLEHPIDRAAENAALRTIARLDGTPFPTTGQLAKGWLLGRTPIISGRLGERELETAYCSEIVALTYEAMGLLQRGKRASWYDPGKFWSGDTLPLLEGAHLGEEIAVDVPASAKPSRRGAEEPGETDDAAPPDAAPPDAAPPDAAPPDAGAPTGTAPADT